jgi:Plasmid pRiA4b ORF-3-like protein
MQKAGKRASKVTSKGSAAAVPQTASTPGAKPGAGLVEMKVTLDDVTPPIVRKLVVSTKHSLDEIHDIIQTAMGWNDLHMHAFQIPRTRKVLGIPSMFESDMEVDDEEDVFVRDLLARGVQKMKYTYDFGDNWVHTNEFGNAVEAIPGALYPICVDGTGACPPEDCGGPWGYAERRSILQNPKHPGYKDAREWLGSPSQLDKFSVREVNECLHSTARGKANQVHPGEEATK